MNNNYNITYPTGDDYYDINIFNKNFSNLADGIDEARAGGSKGEVIVAAYNSQSPLKDIADFVCTEEDCTPILTSAIEKAYSGGTLRLLDGSFNFYTTFNITKPITLKGDGKYSTTFYKKSSVLSIIDVKANKTTIKDIGMCFDYEYNNSYCFIVISHILTDIDNCYFNIPTNDTNNDGSIILLKFMDGIAFVRNCVVDKYDGVKYLVSGTNSRWRGSVKNIFINNLGDKTRMPVIINVMNAESLSQIDYDRDKTTTYIRGVLVNEEV